MYTRMSLDWRCHLPLHVACIVIFIWFYFSFYLFLFFCKVNVLKWFTGWSASWCNWFCSFDSVQLFICHVISVIYSKVLHSIIPSWGFCSRRGQGRTQWRCGFGSFFRSLPLCVQTGNISCWTLELQVYTEIFPEWCNYVGKEVQFCLSGEVYWKMALYIYTYIYIFVCIIEQLG